MTVLKNYSGGLVRFNNDNPRKKKKIFEITILIVNKILIIYLFNKKDKIVLKPQINMVFI